MILCYLGIRNILPPNRLPCIAIITTIKVLQLLVNVLRNIWNILMVLSTPWYIHINVSYHIFLLYIEKYCKVVHLMYMPFWRIYLDSFYTGNFYYLAIWKSVISLPKEEGWVGPDIKNNNPSQVAFVYFFMHFQSFFS